MMALSAPPSPAAASACPPILGLWPSVNQNSLAQRSSAGSERSHASPSTELAHPTSSVTHTLFMFSHTPNNKAFLSSLFFGLVVTMLQLPFRKSKRTASERAKERRRKNKPLSLIIRITANLNVLVVVVVMHLVIIMFACLVSCTDQQC